MVHWYIIVFSTDKTTKHFDPASFPFDMVTEMTGEAESMYSGSSWVFPMLGEHDFVSTKHGKRGGAIFRRQMHEVVYEALLAMFIEGKFRAGRRIALRVLLFTFFFFPYLFIYR